MVEKHIASLDFAEYFRKSGVLETSKVYHSQYLRNGLSERHCYDMSKITWDIQSLQATGYWSRDEGETG